MNIVTVVQARRGSTRLPDKVMLPLSGAPLLVRMVERVRAARLAGTVVVATTTDAHDDAVEVLCEAAGLDCFRGHPTDLLDRHYQVGKAYGADVVLKIPSDCPLIDPEVIDRTITRFLEQPGAFDFVSNLHPPTYPDGNDVEIMPMAVLETAWREADKPHEREHTTPFIWDRPERFRLGNVAWDTGLDYSMSHRFTIDYREDYEFIRAVFEELYAGNPMFGLTDILRLLEEKPEIYAINAHLAGVNWYRNHLSDLRTISAEQTKTI
jgi:spore coat polysaccharide biosynthesis protein SpsF